jgi:hypothetical protein
MFEVFNNPPKQIPTVQKLAVTHTLPSILEQQANYPSVILKRCKVEKSVLSTWSTLCAKSLVKLLSVKRRQRSWPRAVQTIPNCENGAAAELPH